jgi:hypothetical protein
MKMDHAENCIMILHNLYSLPNTVRVIKSRRIRQVGQVAHMEQGRVFTGFWFRGPKGRDHWEDLGVGGTITLRWTLGKQGLIG